MRRRLDHDLRLGWYPGGLRNRMVLTALIPIVMIAVTTTGRTITRAHELQSAQSAAQSAGRLIETLDALAAVGAERVPTQALQGAEAYGISPALAGLLIGFDPEKRMLELRPQTDAAMQSPRYAQVLQRLRGLRAETDSGTTLQEVDTEWDDMMGELHQIRLADLTALRATMAETHQLESQLEVVLAANEMSTSFSDVIGAVFEIRSGNTEQRAVRRFIAVQHANGTRAQAQVLEASRGQTKRQVEAMLTDDVVKRATLSIDELLANPTRPLINDLTASAAQFTALIRRGDHATRITLAASSELRDEAERSSEDAKQSLLDSIFLALATIAASIGGALWSARSILRPLSALALRAKAVAEGHLESDSLPETGPSEIALVTRAFNHLSSNLETLDQQVVALAEGNLDAPVLREDLPGDIGVSINRTIRLLSHSVQIRDQMEERLAHEASHDPLTGLPNRHAIMRSIEGALRRSVRSSTSMGCLFIDLDGFKRANDFYGHKFGDDLLIMASERLLTLGRNVLDVGRLGGDEFLVVLDDLPNFDRALETAHRIIELLSDPFILDNRVCQIGASVGVALSDNHSTASSIVRDADMAVYRAKQRGGGTVEVFDAALRAEMHHRSDIESAFQQALVGDELWIAYQPIVEQGDSGTSLAGLEALIRWDRPGHGPVSPADFVPLLEKGPYVIELSRYVLRRALRELPQLRTQLGAPQLSVNINLSVRDLALDGLVDEVISEVEKAGLEPNSLVIEITETALLSEVAIATEHLKQLRKAGVRIALDDFGTGFTSISQLSLLPIDILKIDRSFTSLVTDPVQRPIVEMMIGVGRTLGLTVVAEGVETAEESAALVALGCSRQQGWLHGRPHAPDRLTLTSVN